MNWFRIAYIDIKLIFKEKMSFFWTFIAPIIFISFFGIIFKNPEYGTPKAYIENYDQNNTLAKAVEIFLKQKKVEIVKNKDIYPHIFIPKETTERLIKGEKVHIYVKAKDEADLRSILILLKLQSALMNIVISLEPEMLKRKLTPLELENKILIEPIIILKEKEIKKGLHPIKLGFQRSVPQTLVMLILMFLFTGLAADLVAERNLGYMKRLMIAPIKSWEIIAGKLASRIGWSIIAITFIIFTGKLIYKVNWGNNFFALFLILFNFAIASSAMGMYFSTFFVDPNLCAGLGAIIIMIISALGGCWWPLEIVPIYLRYVAYIFPTGWTMDALVKIMSYGYSLKEILWNILSLSSLSVILIFLSSKRMLKS